MTRKRVILNRVLLTVPWITLAVLVTMSAALPNRTRFSREAADRKVEIAAAFEQMPLFIGPWVGEDAADKVPREAQQLLRPNALVSRVYQRPGFPTIHVLLVHCGDARDMIGHYPPICYPSSGWLPVPADGAEEFDLDVNGRRLPVRQYNFRLLLEGGRRDDIRVFNAFVLPDGTITREIDDINRQSERLAVSVLGVAQLQVVTSGLIPAEVARQAAGEVLSGMTELFHALGVEQGASRES